MINLFKTHKQKIAVIIIGLICLSFILTCTDGCNKGKLVNKPIQPTNQLNGIVAKIQAESDSTKAIIKDLTNKLEVANNAKPKIVYRKIYVYDSLLIADTACINSLVMLYNQCAKVDSVNEYIIANQSSQIANLVTITNNQQDIIDIRNYQHGVDSVNEVAYKEQIKVDIKNSKRKYRRGLLQGGAVGLGVGFIGGLILLK